MDKQDRVDDIKQHVKEYTNALNVGPGLRVNADTAVKRLDKALYRTPRSRKGELHRKLDRNRLNRRDFLKLLGVSGLGAVAAIGFSPFLKQELGTRTVTGYAASENVDFSGGVDVSQGDGYEIWTPSGHVNAEVGAGVTVENVLIDQTGGGSISFRANANNWTLRNIGWKGIAPSKHESGNFAFLGRLAVPDSGSSATVENIFMEGWDTSMGGIWLRSNHSGTINVFNSYFAGFGNNSIYGSGPGKNGNANGNIIIDSSLSNSSTTGNFRVSGQGSRVRNSVVTLDDPDCNRGHYPNRPDSYGGRPIAARHWDDIVAENCSVYVNPDDCNSSGAYQAWHCGSGCTSNSSQTVLTVRDCHINPEAPNKIGEYNGGTVNVEGSLGNNPTTDVLQNNGVPTSAEMAAQGLRQIPSLTEIDGQPTEPAGYTPRSGENAVGTGGDSSGTIC